MRRTDKEITDIAAKIDVVQKCKVCRLGLSENNMPYIVPLNYGYDFIDNMLTLFFHGAAEGKKYDIIKNNNNACFEIDCDTKLIEGDTPCACGYAFKSVIGFGTISIVENKNEKIYGLQKIMAHQTGLEKAFYFPDEAVSKTTVYKMAVKEFTGKQKEFPVK
jgi:nitroimidazol reductase NimA-like FMN-containing flavoprotein (pyridoxamine 5'-phosphate oxidase superfamily)